MQATLGMSPAEALRAATADAAALIGLDRGTLAPGAAADLVLLDEDIGPHGYGEPAAVVKAGEIVCQRSR